MNKPYLSRLFALCFLVFAISMFFYGCSKSGNNSVPPDKVKPDPIVPVIDSLSASEGDYNVQIIISGSGFSNAIADDHVFFNGKEATISAATATRLTVTVPKDAGTGNVTVKVNSLTVTGPAFTYLGVLALNSISTNSGPYNTAVTITGTGFSPTIANDKVFFNGKPAIITVATATQLTVTVPLAAGTGKITLAVDAGTIINGPVFTYQLSAILTVFAGSGKAGFENGKGTAASFNTPIGIAVDKAGNLYIADEQNNAIRKITPDGTVSTLAGNGTAGADNGTGSAASFNHPAGVAVDNNNNVYVTDIANQVIRKITPDGLTTTFAAGFSGPLAITADINNNLYVTDYNNNNIRKITNSGEISVFKNDISGVPSGIVVDKENNVYVTDFEYNLVHKIFPNGNITSLTGPGSTNGTFFSPTGIAIDNSGSLYVLGDSKISKIDKSGTSVLLGTVKKSLHLVSQSLVPNVFVFTFGSLGGIAIDNSGDIYITDPNDNLIKKVSMQ